MKLGTIKNKQIGDPDYVFYCPACRCDHGIWTTNKNQEGAIWTIDGNLIKPTVRPSLVIKPKDESINHCCHLFITDGMIQYLSDCTHNLKGHTIELPDYETS